MLIEFEINFERIELRLSIIIYIFGLILISNIINVLTNFYLFTKKKEK